MNSLSCSFIIHIISYLVLKPHFYIFSQSNQITESFITQLSASIFVLSLLTMRILVNSFLQNAVHIYSSVFEMFSKVCVINCCPCILFYFVSFICLELPSLVNSNYLYLIILLIFPVLILHILQIKYKKPK